MLTARAFWMIRRSVGLAAGSGPPDLTAMVMSFAMRANCFAMRFHRANIVALRTSKMRPMDQWCRQRRMNGKDCTRPGRDAVTGYAWRTGGATRDGAGAANRRLPQARRPAP